MRRASYEYLNRVPHPSNSITCWVFAGHELAVKSLSIWHGELFRVTHISHILSSKVDFSQFDALVVGSGPSGMIVARTLAENGQNVAILEYGGLTFPGQIHHAHQAPYSKAITEDNAVDGDPWTACCVGGGMQFYDAITFRYQQPDLSASYYISSDLKIDWPIKLADLEPFYTEIEQLLRVSGTNGFPAYPASARGLRIAESMRDLGMKPKSIPLAILHPGMEGGCSKCSACDERVCPNSAKASVFTRDILGDSGLSGSISVFYGCFVNRILQKTSNVVDGVECLVALTSETLFLPANKVIVCCNAIQSAALMLRSKGPHAPNGLGNNYDLVGRGLSFKISGYSTGHASGDDTFSSPHWGPHATVYTDAFYENEQAPSGFAGLIYEANLATPEANCGLIRLHYIAGEEPWSHNRIILGDETDEMGVQRIRFEYRNSDMDLARIQFLAERAEDVLRNLGASKISREPFEHAKGSSHLHGTLRAGYDPSHSVVDSLGKFHGIDNLFTMDGSVMNFAGSSNPTNTIMANARRMASSIC